MSFVSIKQQLKTPTHGMQIITSSIILGTAEREYCVCLLAIHMCFVCAAHPMVAAAETADSLVEFVGTVVSLEAPASPAGPFGRVVKATDRARWASLWSAAHTDATPSRQSTAALGGGESTLEGMSSNSCPMLSLHRVKAYALTWPPVTTCLSRFQFTLGHGQNCQSKTCILMMLHAVSAIFQCLDWLCVRTTDDGISPGCAVCYGKKQHDICTSVYRTGTKSSRIIILLVPLRDEI